MVERIIDFCAHHRWGVLLGVALSLVASWWAIGQIKLDAIPDLSEPQVIVYSEWMGRSPTLVEDQVTHPLVSALVGAPKVRDVRGYSMLGMSFVYVIFDEGTDIYWARSRVLEYLNSLGPKLPQGVNPVLGPDATGIGWVFQYVVVDESKQHDLAALRTLQDYTLRYAIQSVTGVAEVAPVGGHQRQYQVTVDPERLRANGLTLGQVAGALAAANGEVGGRIIELSGREYYVRGRAYVGSLADLENVAITTRGPAGTAILVRDVGQVWFGPELRRGLLEWNGEGEAVGGIVVMRYGENALEVIERVKAKILELQPSLPTGIKIEVAYDRSGIIERSISTLKTALLEEMIAVSAIIILFLLHIRSSLLPIVSLPVAVALSFIPMAFLHLPSTIMSLGGIAIAIGATVDAEIVMIEACHKKLEHAPPGADRRKLLAEAAREVTPAIFFSLLIIAVSFLPVFTLGGQAGRLFEPLAYTKTFVMAASALLSITLAPALRDLLLRGKIRTEAQHPLSRWILKIYEPFVYVALRKPKSTLAIGLLAVISAVPMAGRLGQEFMPPLDEGDILYMPTTLPNLSIEEAKEHLFWQDKALKAIPEVATVFGKVGRAETATDPAPLTMIETTLQLRPREAWRTVAVDRWYSNHVPEFFLPPLRFLWPDRAPISTDALVRELDAAVTLPGWTNAWTMPIAGRVDMLTTGVRTPVGVKVFGAHLTEIEAAGVALESLLAKLPGTRSALYERSLGGLYLDVVPDREALARYGLGVADILSTVEAALGGAVVGTAIEGRTRTTILVRYPRDTRSDLEAVRQLPIPLPRSGRLTLPTGILLAQAMPGMGNMRGDSEAKVATDVPTLDLGGPTSFFEAASSEPSAPGFSDPSRAAPAGPGLAFVPLGQVAKVSIVEGPPMVKNEDGLLVGYVYVDLNGDQDVGGYVDRAQAAVKVALAEGELRLAPGTYLEWTGQYQLLEAMRGRLRWVLPLTLFLVVLLLYFQFRSMVEVAIILLSIPFALVGSVWLVWALDYRISTAVWVGVIALVGLATQTGVVMIVYIDQAYLRRKRAGQIRGLNDIIWAHMEGTVQRVRPKLMTVATMLVGLVPLLWATGSGADVMKRIAAPMVGGLITSAFLTLELIPVIYTYWRYEELLWERWAEHDPLRFKKLSLVAKTIAAAMVAVAIIAVAPFYGVEAGRPWLLVLVGAVAGVLLLSLSYLGFRRGGVARFDANS